MQTAQQSGSASEITEMWDSVTSHDRWMASTGVPIHEGYHIEDVRALELGRWEERGCDAAFLNLAGLEGVSEARVSELAPATTTPPLKFALDEVVYVVEGRGLTAIWSDNGGPKTTFEWQKHSLFVLPRYHRHQISNTQGNRPARLLHYNYLPIAMQTNPDTSFYFDNPFMGASGAGDGMGRLYSEAKMVSAARRGGRSGFWLGNFFPDMRGWDKLNHSQFRGAGSSAVSIRFASAPMTAHMAVFPSRTYKKAHRHGPGVVIVVPAGEGFSVLWPEGKDKIFVRWHEGSVFVPPNRWFHQHFNVGGEPARYLALHSPAGLVGYSDRVEDLVRDQIEYVAEDPWIRQTFEAELAKRGLTSLMPNEAYLDPDYQWTFADGT